MVPCSVRAAGTVILCSLLALLWLLLQLLPLVHRLGRHSSSSGSSGSWAGRWQPTGTRSQTGSWSGPLLRLLLDLSVLSLAGGAAERLLGAVLCQLGGHSVRSSWTSWLSGHSTRSSVLCGGTAAAAAFVLAFGAACVAAHAAQALLLGRRPYSGTGAQPRSVSAWQAAWCSVEHGIELLLLALLARDWWHSCTAAVAAAAGTGSAGGAAGLAQAAGLVLSLLPRPLALRAAGQLATTAQPWLAWWRGGGNMAPSAVLLVAGHVAAQHLLQARRPQAVAVHAWATTSASRGNLAGSSSQQQLQQLRQRRSLLAAASLSSVHFLSDAALLPLLPALRAAQRWRSAALASPVSRLSTATAAMGAAQTLLLLANRASLGTIQYTLPYATAQLLLCMLAPMLLFRSAALRTVAVNA